ncbi:ATP-binding protein [Pontibacter sp. E15-1]|uniref:ATP-binding protein n=1 Tax=Pontibacter sp. E15-1 TaxID=2919918 RepID=UPI001F4FD861|nr:ATP-binding protein [Pontibacter sp. E15-1]MCJ8163936.1 ATP-binding protein [Pontibacter sp. E15-1]
MKDCSSSTRAQARSGLFFAPDEAYSAISIVRAIHTDEKGNIWVGTDGQGLLKVSSYTSGTPRVEQYVKNTQNQYSLSSNAVYAVFADAELNIWIGTAWNGVNVIERQEPHIQHFYSDFKGNNPSPVLAIYKDDESMWFGTDGFGLNVYHTASSKVSSLAPEKLGRDYVQLIRQRPDGSYFVGTFANGLFLLDPQAGVSDHFRYKPDDPASLSYNDVRDIVEEASGNAWVATWGGGLCYFDNASRKFLRFRKNENDPHSLKSDNVTALAEEADGAIWVGTFGGGLHLFDTSTRKFSHFNIPGKRGIPFSTLNIISLLKDTHGYLWIGTWGQGLFRLHTQSREITHFSDKDGLREKAITALVEDEEGNIWLSTKNGILAFNHATGRFKKYTQLNGGYHINAVYKADGDLDFGGNEGVVSFNPRKIQLTDSTPAVKFTGLKLFNNDVKAGAADHILDKNIVEEDFIELKHNHSLITFEFTALDFPFANHEYAIKLENFDEDWREIGKQHDATFTNLAPGDYTFKVKARVPGGEWGDTYKQIRVLVHKPFWKTWWAYLLYIIFSGFLLYLFYRYTIHLENLKNNLRLEKVKREKEQELNELKLRLFTDVSHEIRTPVTLIMGNINRLLKEKEDTRKEEAVYELKKNGSHLLQLVNELLDFRRIDAKGVKLQASENDFVSFVEEIFLSFSTHAENLHIDYRFSATQDTAPLWFDKEQMEKVVYNLLSNAFKFTDAGGTIQVGVVLNELNVELVVQDTGKGISESKLNKIFKRFYQSENNAQVAEEGFGIGLSIVKNVVKLHHGKVFVESAPGSGSTFTVKLPRGESHLTTSQKVQERDAHENLHYYTEGSTSEKEDQLLAKAFSDATVLVVEDNADIRRYMVQLLQPLFQVIEASNGAEAYAQAIAKTPDLIISDVMMPEKDGIALTKDLKGDVRTSHIPIILLTARTSFIYKKKGLETGADDYVTKPFSEALLLRRVVNLLKNRKLVQEKFQIEALTEPQHLALDTPDQKFLAELTDILESNLDNEALNAEFISREIGISHSVVYKKVKALTGFTLVEFIRDFRLRRAGQLLKECPMSVTDVCFMVGFADRKYFSQIFKKKYGVTPSEYSKGMPLNPVV